MKMNLKKMVLSALFIAIGFLLPFLTGQIPQVGSMLSPMHIPALLCGFACGWPYALAVGFIMPLLRSLTLGMPPLFPTALAMAFELAAYGCLAGLLYQRLNERVWQLYLALALAMLGGRVVWGLVSWLLYGVAGNAFTFQMFLSGAFVKAVPGILLHIVIIPPIVLALRKAGMIDQHNQARVES